MIAKRGWYAARPSGTESTYKIYGESFNGPDHLRRILEDAQSIVDDALAGDPPLRDAGRAAPERTRGA